MWLLFVANVGRPAVSYQSLEDLVIAHVWLAFFLCYLWLRHKRLAEVASVLGAGVFVYSGYMVNQLRHLGVAAGYAWIPLAFCGIDQAIDEQRWWPLWKVAAASALCFLAGYSPTWFVFALCTVSYAAWHWRTGLGAILAIAASLLIAAVQVLPALDATAMKAFEARYGTGQRNPGLTFPTSCRITLTSVSVPNQRHAGPAIIFTWVLRLCLGCSRSPVATGGANCSPP